MLSSESGRSADVGKKIRRRRAVPRSRLRAFGSEAIGGQGRGTAAARWQRRRPQRRANGGKLASAGLIRCGSVDTLPQFFFVSGKHLRKILPQVGCKSAASRLQACRKSVAIPLRADVLKRGERSCENKAFAVHRSAFFAKIMRADATARRGVRCLGSGSARGGKGAAPTESKGDL